MPNQSIHSAQIEFNALNTITLHEMYTSCNNACNRITVIIIYYFIYTFIILIPL